MTSINRVTLIGNIGQPPELKAAGNQQYARFTMATNENYQDGRESGRLIQSGTL